MLEREATLHQEGHELKVWARAVALGWFFTPSNHKRLHETAHLHVPRLGWRRSDPAPIQLEKEETTSRAPLTTDLLSRSAHGQTGHLVTARQASSTQACYLPRPGLDQPPLKSHVAQVNTTMGHR